MDNVIANVGQDSRRNGRVPVDKLVEQLHREREQLIQDKKEIEFQLSEIEDWRRKETSQILMRRMDKTRSIEATTQLESQARERKAPLMKDKAAIEKRLHDIKSKFARGIGGVSQREEVAVLVRIEQLLIAVLSKLDQTSRTT
jgi:chaperonin cofactor prefoldin